MTPSKLATTIVRFPWVFVAVFVAITAFFATRLPDLTLDTEMKSQLPSDLPTRVSLTHIEEVFGGADMAMIVLEAERGVLDPEVLARVETMSERMEHIDGFDRVVSLFTAKDIRGEDGDMLVEPAVEEIPHDGAERKALQERLESNRLVFGNLVSHDFRYTVLIGFLKLEASDETIVEQLQQIVSEVEGPGQAYVGGMPITRVQLTKDMRRDMRRLVPIGLVVMLVFLFVCFRQTRGVALPFLVTVAAIVVGMGLVPTFGWKIHTVTILLPVILLAVANDYGIHLMARYQEDVALDAKATPRELAKRGATELTRPIVATGITTAVGLLCLMSHVVVPAKQLGVLAAIGVVFAVFASMTVIPAILALLPRPEPPTRSEARATNESLIDRVLARCARAIPRARGTILAVFVIVAAVLGLGATRVVVDTNPMTFYQRSEPVWRSTHLLNEHLGGWAGVSAVVEGDIKDPNVLAEIDALERHLSSHDGVGTTTSIAAVMRKMNQVMYDGDPTYDAIPATRDLVAQYLLLYSMSADPEDFEKLVDFPYEHALVTAKITDSGTKAATEVIAYLREYVESHPNANVTHVGGTLDVMAEMASLIVRGQLLSIALSMLLIGVLVGVLMRSVAAAILVVFPLLLALCAIFGVMGWFGIELNLVTALLSSILVGVGVDYTIYFLWRYRDERRAGRPAAEAVEHTLCTAGRGIVFNALSVVAGFGVLVVSAFFPVRVFGILVAVSILACLVGALVLLPAIVLVWKPRFLEPEQPRDHTRPKGTS